MGLIVRSSQIHHAGCYTTSRIKKGLKVVEYTGRRISVAEGNRLYDGKEITYLFGLKDGKHVIDGYGIAMYINHSCDPNCTTREEDGRVWIVALRDIAPEEELTYDYMLYDGEGEAPCFCGARECRTTMYSPQEIRRLRSKAKKASSARKAAK